MAEISIFSNNLIFSELVKSQQDSFFELSSMYQLNLILHGPFKNALYETRYFPIELFGSLLVTFSIPSMI